MSSVFSKPAQHNLTFKTDQPSASFEPNVQACDQRDADLIGKIKLAIAKLKTKTKEHCPRENIFAKFPCSICDKIVLKIRMLFIVPAILSGFIEGAIAHLNLNMRSCLMNLICPPFIACYVS